MVLYTLTGNLGRACAVEGPDLVDAEAGAEAFERMRELMALVDPRSFAMDPIDALEAMADAKSRFACAPLIFRYANYAADGFRARRIRFADIPALGSRGPVGSALGGTGIAVSAFGARKKAAAHFACWVASAEVQAGLYASSGGQPAHSAAWDSDAVNAPVADVASPAPRRLHAVPGRRGPPVERGAAGGLAGEGDDRAHQRCFARVSRRQAPAIKASDSSKLA